MMRSLNKFRIDKSIEVIGLDIAEMGGLSNELFDKIVKDTSILNRTTSALSATGYPSPS